MGSLREITENLIVFDYACFLFKSQSLVVYRISTHIYVRLSKIALIAAIRYYLLQLHMLGHDKDIKRGFVLYRFKYYELSVYLHGLMQVYCGLKGFPPVGNLFIKRFSRLPHDVMKPLKVTKIVEYAILDDVFGGRYYCSVISGVVIRSCSFDELILQVSNRFSKLASKYDFRFERALPF